MQHVIYHAFGLCGEPHLTVWHLITNDTVCHIQAIRSFFSANVLFINKIKQIWKSAFI
jgi:hypothetical protein